MMKVDERATQRGAKVEEDEVAESEAAATKADVMVMLVCNVEARRRKEEMEVVT